MAAMTAERHLRPVYRDSDDTRRDERVARLAAEQFGVVDLDELRACGLDRRAVSRRVAAGRLHPLYKRVYAVGHPNVPIRGRFLAAVKACGPGAVLSHFAAAVLWRLLRWEDRYPDVLTPNARRHPGITTRRTRRLDGIDIRRRYGIPVTSPARTLVDLAGVMTPKALRRATREALAQGLVTIPRLTEALRRLGPCRGCTKLARILARGHVPTRSELEDAVLDLIEAGGLQTPDVGVAMTVDGRRVVPDFRWAEQRLVVEADGAQWHDNQLAREDDAKRQAILEASGERVVRITWQAIAQPKQTLKRLEAAGAPA
jgi:very-short-patch-repair endonuclease